MASLSAPPPSSSPPDPKEEEKVADPIGQSLDRLGQKTPQLPNIALPEKPIPVIQEETRALLAKRLVLAFGLVIASMFLYLLVEQVGGYITQVDKEEREARRQHAKDVVTLILTATTGIVTSAVGFYFGSQSSRDR